MHLLVTGGAGFIGSNFVSQTLRSKVHPDIPSDVRITVLDALTYAVAGVHRGRHPGLPGPVPADTGKHFG